MAANGKVHWSRVLLGQLVPCAVACAMLFFQGVPRAFAFEEGDEPRTQTRNYRFSEADLLSPEIMALYGLGEEQLPSKFDLRDQFSIPVGDQDALGLCDCFATVKCVETNYALKTGSFVDLSERYLSYMASKHLYDSDAEPGLVPTEENNYATDEGSGAYSPHVLVLLESFGAPTEQAVPYENYTKQEIAAFKDMPCALRATSTVTFPAIEAIEDPGLKQAWFDVVKTHVMRYGSINSAICAPEGDVFNDQTSAAYYKEGVTEPTGGHATSIIGWDDSYPKENFAVQPERDGAFICMNSWGRTWGDDGCFYISYEDENVLIQGMGVLDVEVPYQYKSYTHGSKMLVSSGFAQMDDERFFGVAFDGVQEGELLSHVTIGAGGSSAEVFTTKVRCYLNPTGKGFDKDQLVYLQEATVVDSASHTVVQLDEPIELAGGSFSLVFEMVGDPEDFAFIDNLDAEGSQSTGHMYHASKLDGTWEPFENEFPVYAFTIPVGMQQPTAPAPVEPSGEEEGGSGVLPDPQVLPDPAYEEPDPAWQDAEEDSGASGDEPSSGSDEANGQTDLEDKGTPGGQQALSGGATDSAGRSGQGTAGSDASSAGAGGTPQKTMPAARSGSAAAPSGSSQTARTGDGRGASVFVVALVVSLCTCVLAGVWLRKTHS